MILQTQHYAAVKRALGAHKQTQRRGAGGLRSSFATCTKDHAEDGHTSDAPSKAQPDQPEKSNLKSEWQNDEQEAKRGPGGAAVFIARNRFAVLDKGGNQILVKNLRNEVTRQTPCPLPVTDNIFYAGTGLLLCRSDEKVGSVRV